MSSLPHSAALRREMGYPPFYLDFAAEKRAAQELLPRADATRVARELSRRVFDRETLCRILRRQNKSFGAKAATFSQIDSLTNEKAVVVSAGQQAVLFGGPLMILYKAIWLVKRARSLARELNVPVVPLFWIAADDHDYAEINHTYLFDSLGEPLAQRYFVDEYPGRPAHQQIIGNPTVFAELRAGLEENLGHTDFSAETVSRIFSAYRAGDDFVTCFGRYLADLLPDCGIVLFSPGDEEFKRVIAPVMVEIVRRQDAIHETLSEANSRLSAAGYPLQVQKDAEAAHLFHHQPERTPIRRIAGDFTCGSQRFSSSAICDQIAQKPESFSPDVFTRPIVAASAFPTLMQGGGGAEISYFAQMAPLYKLFDIPTPLFAGRVGATLVEKRFEKLFVKHDLSPASFYTDSERLISDTLSKHFPSDLTAEYSSLREKMKQDFDRVALDVISFDKSLAGNAEQIWGKILHALTTFEEKAMAAHKRKHADERVALIRAASALYPRRALQERLICPAHYLARYSYPLVDFVFERLEENSAEHQYLYLSEMEGA